MPDLTILIPARNEMFLARTIEDILVNIRGDTDIIAVLDGEWAEPPVNDSSRVSLIYHPESVGQRAATNEAARIAQSKYLMKCDAHCAFDEGFDVKMLAEMRDDWVMVPIMRNLHAFDWACDSCEWRTYQGPTPGGDILRPVCPKCGGDARRDMKWIGKPSPQSVSYCFDPEPHFQYFKEFSKRPEGKGDITPMMSLQGSCFMLTRDKYFELNVCDESFGSWGSQGIEVATKFWLSGGAVMVNHKTWYAHMFRTQGKDFGFPYPISGNQVAHAKKAAHDLFFNDKWDKQIHPLSWLVEKFWPVRGWTDEDLTGLKAKEGGVVKVSNSAKKGIVYYTDNRLDAGIMLACQKQLLKSGLPIISVSLEPLDFGDRNIVIDAERGYLTMFKQILAGVEASGADILFFAEHDVLYHPSHFDFVPEKSDLFYYNQNSWKVDSETGHALFHYASSTSGLCAYRDLLLEHYRKRVAIVEENGFTRRMGFEPGTHNRAERVDDYKSEVWMSEQPNVDIRHSGNLTKTRWHPEEFRNQRYTRGWAESGSVPGWGVTEGRFSEVLNGR